ncbi:MAG: sortase [Acidimicrobiaceae bacterium]|nr:sortase [Acidimicrobiaceae bacterium]
MDLTRRLLAIVIAALLVTSVGAVVVRQTSTPATADVPVAMAAVAPPVTEPPTTTAPTTAAPAPPPPAAVTRPSRPVNAPVNEYAPEPIVKIGTIEIPKIGVVSPIYHGISMRNIDLGPSHWPGTAMPGEAGNTVFAGHRVTHTHPFLHIDQLVPGDQVIFTVNGVRSVYVVSGHEVVKPTQTEIVAQTATPTATLFACHPPHSALYRYVVHLVLDPSAAAA